MYNACTQHQQYIMQYFGRGLSKACSAGHDTSLKSRCNVFLHHQSPVPINKTPVITAKGWRHSLRCLRHVNRASTSAFCPSIFLLVASEASNLSPIALARRLFLTFSASLNCAAFFKAAFHCFFIVNLAQANFTPELVKRTQWLPCHSELNQVHHQ